jgi:hypothetical protein
MVIRGDQPLKNRNNCYWPNALDEEYRCPPGTSCMGCKRFRLISQVKHKKAPDVPCQRFIEKDKQDFGCDNQGRHCNSCDIYLS